MGTHKQGILGAFSGKIGTVIGSKWRGKWVMRGLITSKRGKPNPKQIEQQAKFSLMIKFLRPLNYLVMKSYDTTPGEMSGMNNALSDNIRDAITGVYPAFAIDYSKLMVSKGPVVNERKPDVTSPAAGKLVFTWTYISSTRIPPTDMAFVVVYNEEFKEWIFMENLAARNAGTCTLDVPEFSGKPVQTYFGYISADGVSFSDSMYTGLMNIL